MILDLGLVSCAYLIVVFAVLTVYYILRGQWVGFLGSWLLLAFWCGFLVTLLYHVQLK